MAQGAAALSTNAQTWKLPGVCHTYRLGIFRSHRHLVWLDCKSLQERDLQMCVLDAKVVRCGSVLRPRSRVVGSAPDAASVDWTLIAPKAAQSANHSRGRVLSATSRRYILLCHTT